MLTVDVESPKIATAAFCCCDKPTEKLHPERNRQKKARMQCGCSLTEARYLVRFHRLHLNDLSFGIAFFVLLNLLFAANRIRRLKEQFH